MIKSEKPSKRAKWNKEMDTVLLRCLTKLKDLGKMEANGFKEADWRTVQSNWNGKFMANNIQLDKRQLQTRFQNVWVMNLHSRHLCH
ncbi:hypothetical protein BKA69DRAFT_375451 [Paraphysoderma sedebokerense]|nr:hypothetical protein BKA69DRAFT_375451 [Paraphysoderma sedebokerense]